MALSLWPRQQRKLTYSSSCCIKDWESVSVGIWNKGNLYTLLGKVISAEPSGENLAYLLALKVYISSSSIAVSRHTPERFLHMDTGDVHTQCYSAAFPTTQKTENNPKCLPTTKFSILSQQLTRTRFVNMNKYHKHDW